MKPRSTRLNKDNRNNFVKAVLEKHLPESNIPRDVDFRNRWAEKAYETTYGPYLERMKALPEWFFQKSRDFMVYFPGDISGSNFMSFPMPYEVLCLNENRGYGRNSKVTTAIEAPEDSELYAAFAQHRQAQSDFQKQRNELRKQVTELANSCNTSGQLFQAWPEALEYADCFPYQGPKRHQGATVSATEMDIGLKVAKATIKLPDAN